ncbi:hypothetical protein BpHYR1_002474 [Brachionus plicatilis]|uniref:Uncharacterized protein n=1 Tax=Brachionus plicatilis TaxID=10195 RepID=A0A3M7SB33_BRAPC|nr:hypothetical protein BpHYR1_002474 [Brachionus plicatilis]
MIDFSVETIDIKIWLNSFSVQIQLFQLHGDLSHQLHHYNPDFVLFVREKASYLKNVKKDTVKVIFLLVPIDVFAISIKQIITLNR